VLKTLKRLSNEKQCNPPPWLLDNIHYLCQMGSVAYGVSNDQSDIDVYGFCIPKKETVFPHTGGLIHGFDDYQEFDQWQEHHITDKSTQKEYDFSVYSIIKYFRLVMDNNPNLLDSLFVPRRCVLHISQIGELIRENRHIFLHKGAYHKLKGYAYSQMHKMDIKEPKEGSKRYNDTISMGYDTKFLYHVVRLVDECEQILVEEDLVLDRNREQLKSIRRGEWSKQQIVEYFADKEKQLEEAYSKSTLPKYPRKEEIKNLLIKCLEMHFGDLGSVVYKENSSDMILNQIRQLVL